MVYSTNSAFEYSHSSQNEEVETLPKEKQNLIISIDRRNRGGKQVTLITGFVGTLEDITSLAKFLKTKCGTGGAVKEGEIIIQGDMREKILSALLAEGYRAKRGN